MQSLPEYRSRESTFRQTAEEWEWLGMLVADVSPQDLQQATLAFLERYRHNIIQLKHERDVLYTALQQAWQGKNYTIVMRIVAGLSELIAHLPTQDEGEKLLQRGLAAAQEMQDERHHAYFLHCLGCLLLIHGEYQRGVNTWWNALELGQKYGLPEEDWQPLSHFAIITDILNMRRPLQSEVEALLFEGQLHGTQELALAFFVRGFRARLDGELGQARQDLRHCLRILTESPGQTGQEQLFLLAVQTELARASGDYERAQSYAATTIALSQVYSNDYTSATLLIDQALYTWRLGKRSDTYRAYLQLRDRAIHLTAPHIHQTLAYLEQVLGCAGYKASGLSDAHSGDDAQEIISTRELEVLRLVATGLSNNEIAEQLVITRGTVKKHLEHIYIRLNVHTRTAAVARARALLLF